MARQEPQDDTTREIHSMVSKVNVHVVMSLISLMGVMYVAWIQSTTNKDIAAADRQPEVVQSCFERTERLVSERDAIRRENINLLSALTKEITTKQVLIALLDALDQEIWVKVKVTRTTPNEYGELVDWVMLYANKTYRESYGISAAGYEGKTDRQAGWSKEEAEQFYWNDMVAYKAGIIETQEQFRANILNFEAELITKKVIKKLIQFPDGQQALIGTTYDLKGEGNAVGHR